PSRQIRITSSRAIPTSFQSSSGVRWFAISLLPRKSPPRLSASGPGLQLLAAQDRALLHAPRLVAVKLTVHPRIIDPGDGCDDSPGGARGAVLRAPWGADPLLRGRGGAAPPARARLRRRGLELLRAGAA